MDSLTHFHSKNVFFYVFYSYSLKVSVLSIFQNFCVDTNPKVSVNRMCQFREFQVFFFFGFFFCFVLFFFFENLPFKTNKTIGLQLIQIQASSDISKHKIHALFQNSLLSWV